MPKTAIILGASGLTGGILLQKLLQDKRYSSIKLFGRTKLEQEHEKVQQFVGDLLNLESFSSDFTGDELYCCIGTTKKKTPDEVVYRKIDFGIPVDAAQLCNRNGIKTIAIISSVSANEKSKNFYLKTKGEMEKAVLEQEIENTFILRPSLIVGNRGERRAGERFTIGMMKLVNPLLFGGLKKYRSIKAEKIAEAMITLANSGNKKAIFESDEIQSLLISESK
ncbi:NAD(P)H-binding protein [Crocinitomicaceae bacterium]|nr:NAD(P)H-binding protein [Crocinitomicaceae bacterium]MDB3906118.1 NAD(P)H-binding protein [Crocinitomicaceae bacterium]